MTDKPPDWDLQFDRPIMLPDGEVLATLDDGRRYLLTIPESEYTKAVGLAADLLVKAAEHRDFVMHANIAVGRVVHGEKPIPEPRTPKKKWDRVKLLRDR